MQRTITSERRQGLGVRRAGADFTASAEMKIIRADGTEVDVGNPSHDDKEKREAARRKIAEANKQAEEVRRRQGDES